MDLIKIGKFIAERRKEKHLTQEQLAEKLYITDRAVSKWERGLSLPDACNMLDLCNILEINVNELLNGEKIDMKDYNKKTEELLLELAKQEEVKNKKILANMWVLMISALLFYLGIVERNIMESVAVIKVPKEVREPFSDIEIDMLRGACKNLKERALVETLLATGVRVDELSKMNIDDIDFSTMTVHVLHGKGAKERITYINNIGRKHLMAYLESRKDNCLPLFVNYRKDRLNNGGIRNILNTIGTRVGVENVYPHRFRRTFATGLAARGMDIQEIQKLLGHSNVNTTMKYIKINDDQVQASYRRFIA